MKNNKRIPLTRKMVVKQVAEVVRGFVSQVLHCHVSDLSSSAKLTMGLIELGCIHDFQHRSAGFVRRYYVLSPERNL